MLVENIDSKSQIGEIQIFFMINSTMCLHQKSYVACESVNTNMAAVATVF